MLTLAVSLAAALAFGQTAVPEAPDGPGFIEIAHVGAQDRIIPTIVIARHGNTLFYEKNFGPGFERMPTYYFDDFLSKTEVQVAEVDDDVFAAARRITETMPCTTRRGDTGAFGGTLATVRVPAKTVAYRCGMSRSMVCAYFGELGALFAAHGLATDIFGDGRREIECNKPN